MGINKFFDVTIDGKPISDFGANVILKDLSGYQIAVDGNLMAYSISAAISPDKALLDSNGNVTSHIQLALNKIVEFNKNKIRTIWVFDNPIKNDRKEETYKKRKANTKRFIMTSEYLDEIKYVLELMGIPYIIVPPGIEAEQYGAWLTVGPIVGERYCQYVLTSDSDTILFGGNMLRFYKKAGKWKYQLYEYAEILNEMDITHEQLEAVATALGHDFYPGIRNIGPKRVLERVKDGKIILNDEQIQALAQFRLDPTEYLAEAEFYVSEYDREKAETWFESRSFNMTTLRKKLDKFTPI